jgi:hypothetical protein
MKTKTKRPDDRKPGQGMSRGSREEARIEIPCGEPDVSALRSIMRDWLIPRLVEDFLRERGIELKYSRVHVPKNPTFKI